MSREVVISGHLYDPAERRARHHSLPGVWSNQDGEYGKPVDYTANADRECYQPLAESGLFGHLSYNAYGVTRWRLDEIGSTALPEIEANLGERGHGETAIHAMLPDLNSSDRQILIHAGKADYEATTGKTPQIMWPAEGGIDTQTLVDFVDAEYQAVIVHPNQIRPESGYWPANQPHTIDLPGGRQIIALPFDPETTNEISFHKPENAMAPEMASHVFEPKLDQLGKLPLFLHTDMETFGHHWKGAVEMLDYLINHEFASRDISLVSANEWLGQIDLTELPKAEVVERSAWSCHCGNLARWNGACGCHAYEGKDLRWKADFYQTFAWLNQSISGLAQEEFGAAYQGLITDNLRQGLYNPGGEASNPQLSLISAKVLALYARTSCGTFFADFNTSGPINLLKGYEALLHLSDSGLSSTSINLEAEYWQRLGQIQIGNNQTAADSLWSMLQSLRTAVV